MTTSTKANTLWSAPYALTFSAVCGYTRSSPATPARSPEPDARLPRDECRGQHAGRRQAVLAQPQLPRPPREHHDRECDDAGDGNDLGEVLRAGAGNEWKDEHDRGADADQHPAAGAHRH